jgi:hypothetical protein
MSKVRAGIAAKGKGAGMVSVSSERTITRQIFQKQGYSFYGK